MSDYTIVIHGTGHTKHNVSDSKTRLSADALLDIFVGELKQNDHIVEVATITHGGREKIIAD